MFGALDQMIANTCSLVVTLNTDCQELLRIKVPEKYSIIFFEVLTK